MYCFQDPQCLFATCLFNVSTNCWGLVTKGGWPPVTLGSDSLFNFLIPRHLQSIVCFNIWSILKPFAPWHYVRLCWWKICSFWHSVMPNDAKFSSNRVRVDPLLGLVKIWPLGRPSLFKCKLWPTLVPNMCIWRAKCQRANFSCSILGTVAILCLVTPLAP